MGKHRDLTGLSFGRLTVIRRVSDYIRENGKPRARWLCRCCCEDGIEKIIMGENLTRGLTESCGCLQRIRTSEANKKHGESDSRLHNVWLSMRQRCYNPGAKAYPLYGGRGIKICDEWLNDYSVFMKWALKNGYNPEAKRGECTIDRIDNNRNYSPDNCRVATQREQMNNVRYNRLITHEGQTRSVADWARLYNMNRATLYQRIFRYGYAIEKALTTA